MRIDFTPRRLMEPNPNNSKKDPVLTDESLRQLDDLERSLLEINDQIGEIGKNLSKSVTDQFVASIYRVNELSDSLRTTKDISKSINDIQGELNRALIKDSQLSVSRIIAQNKLNEAIENRNLTDIRTYKQTLKQLDAELEISSSIIDQLRTLSQVAEAEKEVVQQAEKQKKIVDDTFKKIKDKLNAYLGIAAIFQTIINSALRYNAISVDIGKNTGYGADQANRITDNLVDVAQKSDNINVTLKNVGEAMSQIGEATGLYGELSADALETQIMLTKQLGLSGEEAAGIYKFSLLTGQESSKINDEMLGAFVNARNQYKVGVSLKGVFAEAAKVSGRLAANLQNNPAAITKAIIQAKAFGTSIEQIAKQGDSLLDFEQSLENELKAELLTGKQLNLERARAAALSGDQITLAEELNKNVGTLDDFQKMNVLQQKSLAAAMGLTVDELADQLRKQKMAQEQGKSLEQITKEEADQAEKRQKIQEKFTAAIEKLQDLIGNIVAGPLGQLLEMFTNVLGLLTGTTGQVVAFGAILLYAAGNAGKIAAGFKGALGSSKELTENVKKLFSKEGRASIFGGADKAKDTITSSRGITLTKAADKSKDLAGKAPEGGAAKGAGIQGFLTGLANGLKAFGQNAKDVLKGALTLAASAVLIGGALVGLGLAFQALGGDPMVLVGLGVALAGFGISAAVLGKFSKDIMKGATAMLVLGIAMIPFAIALSLIAGLNMEAILAAGAGLLIFGAAVIGLGALIMTGVGAALFGAGIVGLIALGAAMIVLGVGLAVVAAAGKGITGLFESLTNLDVDKLNAIAPALESIGVGILALGAGSVLTAIGGILGGGPVEVLQGIANTADGIQTAATSLQALAGALIGVSAALATIDTSKLEALDEFSSNQASNSAVNGITGLITAPIRAIDAIGDSMGGKVKEAGIDLTPMIAAINEVKASVQDLQKRPVVINMDGKQIGSNLAQGSYKLA
jgi:hypothetical protein